jgi:electron transfer flavoprotein beta subunit
MKIIVSIKQVPDTFDVKIDPETKRIVREGVESVINPYDMYAIEEAVRVKERFGGEVTVISMGPPQAEKAVKDAIAMGADKGILVSDRKFAGSDTYATSYVLGCTINKIKEYDLIICGRETLDGSTAQVGPEIAEYIKIPFVAYVSKINDIKEGKMECIRLMEEHYETLQVDLPALITVTKEINEPRIPSLKGMLKAKKSEIPVWSAEYLEGNESRYGQDGSPTKVMDVWTEEREKEGEVIEGEPDDMAEKILEDLQKQGVV